jgi:hypothetical protein
MNTRASIQCGRALARNGAVTLDTNFIDPPAPGFFAVGAGRGSGPRVEVFDSNTGALRASFFAFDPSFLGGVSVTVADVNGDGFPDLILGAGPGGGPHVKVFDGQDGHLVRSFMAYDPSFHGGVFVAAGDIAGDGRIDIVTGAGPGGGPHVKVFQGADLTLLESFFAYDPAFTGGVSVAVAEVNGDGKADLITGAGPGGGPQVKVFQGTDLTLLQSFFAYDPGFLGGVSVTGRDLAGDPHAEILTGAGPGSRSQVKAFRGTDLSLVDNFFAFDPLYLGGVFVG